MGVTTATLELLLVFMMMQCAPSSPRPGVPAAGAVGRTWAEVLRASQLPGGALVQTVGSAVPTSCPRLGSVVELSLPHRFFKGLSIGGGGHGSMMR
jgi:hypothetical protein